LTQALKGRKLLLVGFTLFSMFFGAGNLIFPPDLGAKAGANLWPAFLGLAISAVGLPVAGVIAVARADGLDKLAGRVHPVFAQVFMILIYLSIGPCLAIPRTASTSFAMLTPLLGSSAGLQLGYSALFFGMAFLVALRPDRLTRWLGRLLCPCLLVLILILFGGCLLHPLAAQYAAPTETYRSAVVLQGVLYGYQTMDALAALNFGAVIAMNIRAQGVVREQDVQRSAIRAGFIAGGLLLAVYAMLGHAGALTGAAAPGLATGAEVLTVLAERLFGKAGLVLLAAIFMLACFKHLCGADRLCGGVFPHPASPHPLPCSCRLFCRCQYADRKSGAGRYPTVIRPGAQRPVPGSHCADYAFLRARVGTAPPGLSAVHRLHCRAEHCRRAAAWPAFCSCQRPAAGGVGLWLGAPGGRRAACRHPFELYRKIKEILL